jgi:hypothetical protein
MRVPGVSGRHQRSITLPIDRLFLRAPDWPPESGLPNDNFEPVFVAVPEVFLPLVNSNPYKRNIHPVLLHQVRTVLTIFVAVPIMIIVMVPIVIALFTVVIVSHHRNWSNQGRSRQQPSQNQKVFKVFHVVYLCHDAGTSLAAPPALLQIVFQRLKDQIIDRI